jgi:hypothetical protein
MNRNKNKTPRGALYEIVSRILKVRGILVLLLLSHGWSSQKTSVAVRRHGATGQCTKTSRHPPSYPGSGCCTGEEQVSLGYQGFQLGQRHGIMSLADIDAFSARKDLLPTLLKVG